MNEIMSAVEMFNSEQSFGTLDNVVRVFTLGVTAVLCTMLFTWAIKIRDRGLYSTSALALSAPLVTLAIFSIITVIQTNLVLSLGLVGALSIVRYRTPIREGRELAYYFVAITIGIIFGATHVLIGFGFVLGGITLIFITTSPRFPLAKKLSTEGRTITVNGDLDPSLNVEEILTRFSLEPSRLRRVYASVDGKLMIEILVRDVADVDEILRNLPKYFTSFGWTLE